MNKHDVKVCVIVAIKTEYEKQTGIGIPEVISYGARSVPAEGAWAMVTLPFLAR